MTDTAEKPRTKIRGNISPDLLEQYYHESSRVWKVVKEKSKQPKLKI